MNIQQFFQTIVERLQSSAHIKTVYGEPVVAAGKTIIPVAKVAYGFGGGGGTKKNGNGEDLQEGGGGGGGAAAIPVGVVEITEQQTRFIAFGEKKKLAGALLLGVAMGIWLGRKRS
jgi:uncharacterized spore protein YtfJ